jgi:CheY-like chemotaxis protein
MGSHILLVEDEPTLQRILGSVLTDAGHQVDTVGTAEGAIDRLRERDDVDLVLSDKNLPGMNGLDLLDHVRALEPQLRRTIGFVLVTGYPSRDSAVAVLANDGDGYLVKPFRSLARAQQDIDGVLQSDLSLRRRVSARARAVAAIVSGGSGDSSPSLAGVPVCLLTENSALRERVIQALRAAGARPVATAEDALDGVVCATELQALKAAPPLTTARVLCDPAAPLDDLVELIGGGGAAIADPTRLRAA